MKRPRVLRTLCGRLRCARRAARCGSPAATAWKPIALRWPGRSRRFVGAVGRLGNAVTAYHANLQLHWHFAALVPRAATSRAGQAGRTAPVGHVVRRGTSNPAAGGVHATRPVTLRRREARGSLTAPPHSLASSPSMLHQSRSTQGGRGGSRNGVHADHGKSLAARVGLASGRVAGAAAWPRAAATLRYRMRHAVSFRATAGTGRGGTSMAFRVAPMAFLSAARSITSTAVPKRAAPESAAATRLVSESRVAEMLWRTRADGDVASSPPGANPWRGASRPAAPAFDAGPALAVRAPDRQALALDPAFTEKLADDVIRRIDRRARIERERRGL
jgi:hypothetical protein